MRSAIGRWAWLFILPALVGVFYWGRSTVEPVRLLDEGLVRAVQDLRGDVRALQERIKKPIVVSLPGTKEKVPVIVEVVKETIRDRIVPRTVERVVTVTKPAYCETREKCDQIYAAAEQRIEVKAAVRKGTVVPVAQGDQVAQLPLAEDFPFTMRLVLSRGGVFHALDHPSWPVKPLEVRTETVLPPAAKPEPSRWTFGTFAGWSTRYGAVSGLEVDYRLDRWGSVQGWVRVAGEHRWNVGQQDVRLGLVTAPWLMPSYRAYTMLSARDGLVVGGYARRRVGRMGEIEFVIRAGVERSLSTGANDVRTFLEITAP